MKSNAVQEMVKKIFSSEETRSQFMADPESVIARFDLTETEKKAVLANHAKLGLVTGGSTQLEAAVSKDMWFAPAP